MNFESGTPVRNGCRTESKQHVCGFGLIIIGNEILDGRQEDAHFVTARRLLDARHLALTYSMVLPDDARVIEEQLRWAMARSEPFFCCGGIGATPDDLTRDCAARAAGVDVCIHPEGEAILRKRLGARLTPARLKLVEFPRGCSLVINPVNQVPGFNIANGYFLPGFPNMAEPMMEWVLTELYEVGTQRIRCTIVCPEGREGGMAPMMEAFMADNPGVSFSSLPRYTDNGCNVLLGLSGPQADVEAGRADLLKRLAAEGIEHYESEMMETRPSPAGRAGGHSE